MRLYLLVNDIFCPGSDAETITLDDVPELYDGCLKYDWVGIVAWVGKKRNKEPWRNKPKNYDEAISYLENKWKHQPINPNTND